MKDVIYGACGWFRERMIRLISIDIAAKLQPGSFNHNLVCPFLHALLLLLLVLLLSLKKYESRVHVHLHLALKCSQPDERCNSCEGVQIQGLGVHHLTSCLKDQGVLIACFHQTYMVQKLLSFDCALLYRNEGLSLDIPTGDIFIQGLRGSSSTSSLGKSGAKVKGSGNNLSTMCHGLIDQRACTISVPDLLRAVSFEEPDYKYVDDYPSVYGSGSDSLLPESSGLSDDALADVVKDYSSAVKKFDPEDIDNIEADALASTGSLSTWFDCIKDGDFCSATDSISTKSALLVAEVPSDTSNAVKVAPKSRKARKSAVVKEQSHAQDDSEMDDEAPVLIDEKRKRRMSSNRASAQRSRQRKQERLDELEILTAQLRLENATLARRSKIAEQLAKKFQIEKNETTKKVEKLRQELEAARHSRTQGSSDTGNESKMVNSGICNMVGGETSPDTIVELETSFKGNPENVSMNFNAKKRKISSTDLSRGIFQDLYDAIDYDQFDVSIGGEVPDLLQEEWYGSFTECLNA